MTALAREPEQLELEYDEADALVRAAVSAALDARTRRRRSGCGKLPRFVPTEPTLRELVVRAAAAAGGVSGLAPITGVNEETLRGVAAGRLHRVKSRTADRIVVALGDVSLWYSRPELVAAYALETGLDE